MKGFPVVLILAAIVFSSACGPSPRARISACLDDVESYINERPDSALAVLRALEADSLRGPGQRARAALLHQIALDKCYIDITSDSVLSPAFWYLKHGTADQKLKTWYYRSVLARNAGDIDGQMSCLIRAEQYIPQAGDPLMAGRLYTAKRVLYLHIYDLEHAISDGEKAMTSFREAGENKRYLSAVVSLANLYNLLENDSASASLLDTLKMHWNDMALSQKSLAYRAELTHLMSSGPGSIPSCIDRYLAEIPESEVYWTAVARGWMAAGQVELALNALDHAANKSMDKDGEIAYTKALAEAMEVAGHHEEAMDAFRRYSELSDQRVEESLTSKVRFLALEESYLKEQRRRSYWILCLSLVLCMCLVLCAKGYRLSRKRERLHNQENSKLLERMSDQTVEIERLRLENQSVQEEIHQLREMLNQATLPPEINALIRERLIALNQYGVSLILGKDLHARMQIVERLHLEDKERFGKDLYRQFAFLYPGADKSFYARRLTDQERMCSALLLLGFPLVSVARFVGVSDKRCYNICSMIRRKLGISKKDHRSLQSVLQAMVGSDP